MTLTREEILAMEPGRELDALIAKHVMGLDMVEGQLPQLPRYYLTDYEKTIHRDVPLYSSEISTAYEVLANEKSHQLTYSEAGFSHSDLKYRAIVGRNQDVAYAKTAPEAICKARLLAVLNL